jgi:hypothetical protein
LVQFLQFRHVPQQKNRREHLLGRVSDRVDDELEVPRLAAPLHGNRIAGLARGGALARLDGRPNLLEEALVPEGFEDVPAFRGFPGHAKDPFGRGVQVDDRVLPVHDQQAVVDALQNRLALLLLRKNLFDVEVPVVP